MFDLRPGEEFAGFLIERRIGRGGSGVVYQARDPEFPRLIALKLLLPEISDEESRLRFVKEGDLSAQLDHPNIVTIFNRGIEDDILWFSMQYVDGIDASALVDTAPEKVLRIGEEVARALDHAHGIGIIHRDVKPSNILISRNSSDHDERVLLADFGIARLQNDPSRLTETNSQTGTAAFMSPEQIASSDVGHQSDQYSLACTLFTMLTGQVPYDATSPYQMIYAHVFHPPLRLSELRPELQPLDSVFLRALSKEPRERFDDCAQFLTAAWQALRSTDLITDTATTPTCESAAAGGTRDAATPAVPRNFAHRSDSSEASNARTVPFRSRRSKVILALAVIAAAILFAVANLHIPQGRRSSGAVAASHPRSAGQLTLPFTGLDGPTGVAVDHSGAVYVTDSNHHTVLRSAQGAATPTTLPFGNLGPVAAVAVDSAGTVYVADHQSRQVLQLPRDSNEAKPLPFNDLSDPAAIAVDKSGAVYVADNETGRVLRLRPGSTTPEPLPFNVTHPTGVAVDNSGDVYVTDGAGATPQVLRWSPGAAESSRLHIPDLGRPAAIAVDASGALYIADHQTEKVLRVPAGTTRPQPLPFQNLEDPASIAVDASGAVYVADYVENKIYELP